MVHNFQNARQVRAGNNTCARYFTPVLMLPRRTCLHSAFSVLVCYVHTCALLLAFSALECCTCLMTVTHAIAYALNMLNGVENCNACSSARDSDPSGFSCNTAFIQVSNMSSYHSKTLAFIEECRSFTALWDVNHKDCTNKIKRNDALSVLGTNYEMSVKEVRNKIKSLRSYFAKEHQKVTGKKKWCRCIRCLRLSLVSVKITNVHFGLHNTKRN
jgi:hypothetical protein